MKKGIIKLQAAFIALLLCVAGVSNAQKVQRVLNFKQGDEYQKTIYINAVSILQRGKQKFEVKSTSSVSKTYKVTGVTDKGYMLTVTTTRITDTLSAFGKKLKYDSDKPIDTTSYTAIALNTLTGKTISLSIDKNGIITDVNDPAEKYATDTLLSFTGIREDGLIIGKTLDLVVEYAPASAVKKGDSWTTITPPDDKVKITTNYTVSDKANDYTTLALTSASTEPAQNSNVNGTLAVDNASGVIISIILKTATVSYQQVNSALYASARRTHLIETCKKIN